MHKISLFFEFLVKYYYHLVLDISGDIAIKSGYLPSGFEFKILTLNDLYYFKQWEDKIRYLELYETRLQNPDYYCFAVIDVSTDQLAHYSWVNNTDHYFIKEINTSYDLKQNRQVLFEDDNTKEAYRGQKIHTFVMSKRIEFSKKIGATKIFIEIYPRNTVALNTAKKFGFKRRNINPFYLRAGSISYIKNKIIHYVFSRHN
jgi:RimJ/RimL family protein N-acetyltransferase